MADLWMDVDTALAEVPVNLLPLLDDGDFKAIEGAVAYNAAGMALRWHFVTCAGAYTVTSVTPTTGGNYDWTDQGDSGVYTIEIPASGGASINNDTEGFGWFTGVATGVLPWRGPVIGFRAAGLNDLLIENAYSATRGLTGTALPAAAADAAGGVPISDAGGLDLDAKLAATNEVTAARMGALTDWINGGRLDLILDIIAADTTTDIPATLATIAAYIDTEVAALVSELAKVPKSDSNVTWNATALASLQQEATDALNAYDPPTRAELTSDVNSILAILGTPAGASLAADILAIDNFVDGLESTLADGTIGLAALEALVDELETRLTSDRAGYLDNLSAGAAALQASVDDLEGRLSAQLATALAAHSLGIGRLVVDAGSSTTAVVFKTVNGGAASAVNDFYNGRHIVFTSGALALQACSISDYVGATVTATVPALTGAPAEDVTGVIV